MKNYLLVLLFTFITFTAFSQVPYMQTFSPQDIQGGAQTWAATQNNQGVMFFANNDGVLIYDGIDWRLVRLPNKVLAESVVYDPVKDVVYAGGNGQIGYLAQKATGEYYFISLLDQVDEKYRKLKRVLRAVLHNGSLAFSSNKVLYLYNGSKFTCMPLPTEGTVIQANKQLYIRLRNGEHLEVVDQQLKPINPQNHFGADIGRLINACKYLDNDQLLLATTNGFWVSQLAKKEAKPFTIEGYNSSEHGVVLQLLALANDQFLFRTSKAGLIITDKNGKIIYFINQNHGIPTGVGGLINTFQDRDNHLWILLGTGIHYLEMGSAFSVYNESFGLNKSVLSLHWHDKDQLSYVGTSDGIFYINEQQQLIPIEKGQIKNQIWYFKTVKGKYLAAHGNGVSLLENRQATQLISQRWVHNICELANREDAFLFGTYADGLFAAIKQGDKWTKQHVKGFDEEIRFVEEDLDGNIWISHYNKGVYQLKLTPTLDSVLSLKFYNTEHGLPSNENNRLFKLKNGELVITTVNGFYQYDKSSDRFVPHKVLNQSLPENFCIYIMHEAQSGDIWLWAAELQPAKVELAAVLKKQSDGSYQLERSSFYRIKKEIRDISVDIDAPIMSLPNGVALYGKGEELIKYNPSSQSKSQNTFKILFKKLVFGDSVLASQSSTLPELTYEQNDVHIEVAALFYEAVQDNMYRYRLKGYKDQWSEWGHNHIFQFTNLPEGKYTLEVQSKNTYGQFSENASLSFKIKPPFSRTWIAYVLYLLGLSALIYLIVHIKYTSFKKTKRKTRSYCC